MLWEMIDVQNECQQQNQHIHILGICGTFMGGLAIIARQLGYRVTGSDVNVYPPMSDTLKAHGIDIQLGFLAEHLQPHPDRVIVGNVCRRGNPAIEYVLNHKIRYTSGPAWLAAHVLADRHVLAVSGTHGKTTVTSMLAWILQYAGLEPGYLIGGVANNFTTTATLGKEPYFVIEADEYDSAYFDKRPKFLHYLPQTLIINNIEFDHGDIYPDISAIEHQFHLLIRTVPGNGMVLYHEGDVHTRRVLDRGIWSEQRAFNAYYRPQIAHLSALQDSVIIGEHNIENALAAIGAAHHVGIHPVVAVEALRHFRGVKRRMEVIAEHRGITVYDDFAHHPTAIAKTLRALRTHVGQRRMIVLLQFGSNTMRTGQHATEEVVSALIHADRVLLWDPQEPGFDMQTLIQHVVAPTVVFTSVAAMLVELKQTAQSGDVIVIMSNKDFSGLRPLVVEWVRGHR